MKLDGFVVLVDADNTLWDTNALFAAAQVTLLEFVERTTGRKCPVPDRLAFVRSYDQALASRHHLHLKYPVQMLVATLADALISQASPVIAAESILQGRQSADHLSSKTRNDAISAYVHGLSAATELLPRVRVGLQLAKDSGLPLFVITEGKLDLQRKALFAHHLEAYIENIWELTKTVAQFQRLVRRFQPAKLIVIGDQPDRDVVPAHQAGCTTILVRGKFRPGWQSERDECAADYIARNFVDAVEWLLQSAIS